MIHLAVYKLVKCEICCIFFKVLEKINNSTSVADLIKGKNHGLHLHLYSS